MVRECCIYHKRTRRIHGTTESTVGFQTILQGMGIEGDKAHPSCIREFADKLQIKQSQFAKGLPKG